jgi:FkbM family methyltransferase
MSSDVMSEMELIMTPVEPIHLSWALKSLQQIDFPHKLGLCDKVFGRSLASEGVCWVSTAASLPWKLDLHNPTHRWIVYGKYEGSGFLNWARSFLPENGVVVDSGANIGQMLLYFAQWVPKGRVLAFEPGEGQANWLAECLSVNATLPVELIKSALGASPSLLCLQNDGPSLKHGASSFISNSEGTPVCVVRLADELARRSIQRVDLWKLDVEGYELEALRGAEEFLTDQLISAIYAELSPGIRHSVSEYLAAFGYTCYSVGFSGKLRRANNIRDFGMGLFLPEQ